MASEEVGRTLTDRDLARISRVLRWAEAQMHALGIDFGDLPGEPEDGDIVPSYVRITGSPATGDDTAHGIYPAQYVRIPGTAGTGAPEDIEFCYVRAIGGSGSVLTVSPGSGQGPFYAGHVYTNHGTGSLVLIEGNGCTGGTSPTGAVCDYNCQQTLMFDQCNGSIVTHSTLTMFFPEPVKFCLAQSTGPAPPCPTGPTGPSGAKRELRALPTVVGESTLFGKTTLGSVIDVKVNGGTAFQMSKLYNVSHAFDNSATGAWYQVRPISAPVPYGAGNDFELDVRFNGSEQEYRVRRTVGTSSGTVTADFFIGDGTFTTSTGTGATGTNGYAPNMVITQIGNRVAVGKLSTDLPTYLLDLGSAGTGGGEGIALNTSSGNAGPRIVRWRRSGSDRFDLAYEGNSDRLVVTDAVSTYFSWWDRADGSFNSAAVVLGLSGIAATPVAIFQGAGGFVTVRPNTGNNICVFELMPSGTEDESRHVYYNDSDRTNAGALRIGVNGATGYVDVATTGGGTAVTLFNVLVNTQFVGTLTCTASASFQAPVRMTSGLYMGALATPYPMFYHEAFGDTSNTIVQFTPYPGGGTPVVDVAPATGGGSRSQFRLSNGSNFAAAGFLRFDVSGASGTLDSFTTGGGTPVTSFNVAVPTTFTSTGTATFNSRAIFAKGFTVDTAGGNPMLFEQISALADVCVLVLRPTLGNAAGGLRLLSSGTDDSTYVELGNNDVGANAGYLKIDNGQTAGIATISAYADGSGVAPSRLDIVMPLKVTKGIVVEGTGGNNPVLTTQISAVNTVAVMRMQPEAGNSPIGFRFAPSGTGDYSYFEFLNGSDAANAGFFQIKTSTIVEFLSFKGGTGVAPTRLDMTFPVTFTAAGTATFASRAIFQHGLTVNVSGGGNPALITQQSAIQALCAVDVEPTLADAQMYLRLFPSGTAEGSEIRLCSRTSKANSGYLQISSGGNAGTAEIAPVNNGTGTGPAQLDIKLPTRFTTTVGFNNTNPIAKPTVTGSRGGNAALASLLTALANYGLITDSTSA